MSFQISTATDHVDLLDQLRVFLTSTITPVGERWTEERWTGYRDLVRSSELGGGEAFNAFDDDNGSEWRTAIGQSLPSHLGCSFVAGVDVRRVAIRAPDIDSPIHPDMAPDDFTLEYSDDGAVWTPLETFAAGSFSESERKEFTVTAGSPGIRKFWRVNITTNGGNADHTAIARLELLEDISANWFNHAVEAELILRGPGLAAADEIFVGLQTYSAPLSDIYNWRLLGFDGYVPGLALDSQPGNFGTPIGLPLWNQSIPFWMVGNGRRFALVAKVETTYQTAYGGLLLPYATPGQWPYPLCVSGILRSDSETRYSDTGIQGPWNVSGGSERLRVRFVDGSWNQPECWPWASGNNIRDVPGGYDVKPVTLTDDVAGVYGELDGVGHVSGFGNAVENLVQIGGTDHLVVSDVYRTDLLDYHSLQLA